MDEKLILVLVLLCEKKVNIENRLNNLWWDAEIYTLLYTEYYFLCKIVTIVSIWTYLPLVWWPSGLWC